MLRAILTYLAVGAAALVWMLFALSPMAHAELKVTQRAAALYEDGDGKQITFAQALLLSAKGEKVLKCDLVEATVNAAGTSVGMKKVK